MSNNGSTMWYLSRTSNIFLGDGLFLVRNKKQRRIHMNSSFYHDQIEGIQKMKGWFVPQERDDISTTTVFDEVGQIVSYDGDLYVYAKDLTYKKISLAS